MSNREAQDEEKEVLMSIYEGDDCFKCLNDTTYQYRVGEKGHFQSFLLEIAWQDEYPEEIPKVSLKAFYNKHINKPTKEFVVTQVKSEAEQWLGSAMTYTLFEFAKENAEDFMKDQVEVTREEQEEVESNAASNPVPEAKKKVKKEQLTKAQKRKMLDRIDQKGERPRGSDWVDVVKVRICSSSIIVYTKGEKNDTC
ncbi:RWD domain-containing protein 4-like [Apostichopus japonicus]|uniref:RWD domain-containing protein 4-like n=1 Tax=Stichopus japonicus TaxID=307972 RepID=UPI003AB7C4A5